MSNPFVAEIRIFAGNFAPTGWALCNGQLIPISQNTALFSLLGTTYGGNGINTFALPDLQGRAPLHAGQGPGLSNRLLGEQGGVASETLITSDLPVHSHTIQASSTQGTQLAPGGNAWAPAGASRGKKMYASSANTTMSPQAFSAAGGGQAHNNLPPYLILTFIIATQGIYPSH